MFTGDLVIHIMHYGSWLAKSTVCNGTLAIFIRSESNLIKTFGTEMIRLLTQDGDVVYDYASNWEKVC